MKRQKKRTSRYRKDGLWAFSKAKRGEIYDHTYIVNLSVGELRHIADEAEARLKLAHKPKSRLKSNFCFSNIDKHTIFSIYEQDLPRKGR